MTYFRSQETVWSVLSAAWGMLGTGRVWTTPSMGFSCTMSLCCGKLTSIVHYGIVKQAYTASPLSITEVIRSNKIRKPFSGQTVISY